MRSLLRAALLSAAGLATPAGAQTGPPTCLWKARAPSPIPRYEAMAVAIDERLYVLGGFWTAGHAVSRRVDRYDPRTDAWVRLADLPAPITHAGVATDGSRIWTLGGFLGTGGQAVDSVYEYDVANDAWSSGGLPDLPDAQASGQLVWLAGRLHLVGGFLTDRQTAVDHHWVLDLADPAAGWDTTSYAPLPAGRGHHAAIVFDGRIWSVGGQYNHDVGPVDVDWVDVYDPATNAWTPAAPLPHPRSHIESSIFVRAGRIAVAGGRNNGPGGNATLMSAVEYDPVDDAWSPLPPLPQRLSGTLVLPLEERIHLATGIDDAGLPIAACASRRPDATLDNGLRVNCGGDAVALASPWCEDGYWVGGATFATPPGPDVANTDDDALYLTERTGTSARPHGFGYALPVANGRYRVNLHFAEIYWTADGRRLFDVSIEGLLLLDDYDIHAQVGANAAVLESFDVDVSDGMLDISFLASRDRPKVSALEVIALPAAYGCGLNPAGSLAVLASDAVVGGSITLGLDNPLGTQAPGSLPILALSMEPAAGHPCGLPVAGLGMSGAGTDGELLLRLPALQPFFVGSPWPGPGASVPFTLTIPPDPTLGGVSVFAQGLLLDPSAAFGIRFALTEALELRVAP